MCKNGENFANLGFKGLKQNLFTNLSKTNGHRILIGHHRKELVSIVLARDTYACVANNHRHGHNLTPCHDINWRVR